VGRVEGPKTTELAGDALRETRSANERHAALFERVAARIYRYFVKTVWDRNEAEELAQRTLVELERSLREKSYDPARSFNAWMWLKAHGVFQQWCRERATKKMAPLEDVISVPSKHERTLDAEHVLKELQRRLGDECYEVFVLYYEGGLTQTEVAEAVCRDRKTVASRLRQAHELIEELLR
jgi:RNA polymerase sigma factor (sigma-70 family)